jgi:hypothetical protein
MARFATRRVERALRTHYTGLTEGESTRRKIGLAIETTKEVEMSSRFMTLAGLAAVAVIALAWSAFAADGDNGGQGNDRRSDRFAIPMPPPMGGDERGGAVIPAPEAGERGPMPGHPPMIHKIGGPDGPLGGEISYGELHVQRDGEEVVVRVDHGEIAAVDEDSITVSEANGDDVEVPIDDETEVFGGPFRDLSVDDLEEGETVHVSREDGQPAETIGVLPDFEELRDMRERLPVPPHFERAPDQSTG